MLPDFAAKYIRIAATTTSTILIENGNSILVYGMILSPTNPQVRVDFFERNGTTSIGRLRTAFLGNPSKLEVPFLADKGLSIKFSAIVGEPIALTIFYSNNGV